MKKKTATADSSSPPGSSQYHPLITLIIKGCKNSGKIMASTIDVCYFHAKSGAYPRAQRLRSVAICSQ
jgi:hypothetical protein